MTVAELIAQLQQVPQDAMVVVDGDESGYDTACPPRRVEVERVRKGEERYYIGEFVAPDDPRETYSDLGDGKRICVVLISRSEA